MLTNTKGAYVLKEDLHLATPPPHPSEAPIVNPNPLATNPQPATAGTKITLLSLEARSARPVFYKGPPAAGLSFGATASSINTASNDGRQSAEGAVSSEDGRGTSASDIQMPVGSAPAFGEGNSLLTPVAAKDINKRKKPKNNVTKSNSSFISRVIVNDSISKRMTDRPSDGLFAFGNINRAFQWLDMSSSNKVSDTHYLKDLEAWFANQIERISKTTLPRFSSRKPIACVTT